MNGDGMRNTNKGNLFTKKGVYASMHQWNVMDGIYISTEGQNSLVFGV